ITSVWGAVASANSGKVTFKPVNYNTYIASGAQASFGFCANAPSGSGRPVLSAWNMESNAYAMCPSNSGVNPTKAALAVAMAKELGRWEPATDLTYAFATTWKVSLTAAGLARCTNGCPNVNAILGQQESAINTFVDQNVFNPDMLKSELSASIGRQNDLINDLKRNRPSALPPAHKLTLVGGPTNLGNGSCGPHYIFQVDHLDGTPLSSAEASNMANALCFYGQGNCGQNPYIGFAQTAAGCPTGKTCVAVDPTDGDNSSTSTTTAGSAPTYPLNRVYDPSNALLSTQCVSTKGLLGQLVSKCASMPATCGTLYCVAY
ncbi:MAG TPA: cellulose binding domain-containing protein, partial [Polyangiaceae bacterium]